MPAVTISLHGRVKNHRVFRKFHYHRQPCTHPLDSIGHVGFGCGLSYCTTTSNANNPEKKHHSSRQEEEGYRGFQPSSTRRTKLVALDYVGLNLQPEIVLLWSTSNLSYVFNIPYRSNNKLKQVMEKVKEDKKLQTYWKCSNVMAIERMGYTDHGPTHVKIVSNIALKLLRVLIEKKLITPSIVENYKMTDRRRRSRRGFRLYTA